MNLVRHARAFFAAQGLEGRGLVGVSGGLDSVVLLHVLHAAGFEFEVAHVHYGLRGEASEADALLAGERARALGLPFHLYRVPAGERPGRSRQAWARAVRYRFFGEVAEARQLDWVAVAHHADDQAETVLLHLLRGTGLSGLGGMQAVRPLAAGAAARLARPFLDRPRADLLAYAEGHGLRWREDASNADPRYRRAWLRTRLMPHLQSRFGKDVALHIARTAAQVRHEVLEGWQTRRAALQSVAFAPGGVRLGVLRTLGGREQGRLLLDALERFLPTAPRTAAVAAQLRALVEAQVGRHVSFAAGAVWRERDALRFVPAATDAAESAALLYPDSTVRVAGGCVEASAPAPPPDDWATTPDVCWLDADRVVWPLLVRTWQPGDRLQPFGMQGHKKVSDLLTDARVPAAIRRNALVVMSGEKVLWVPGLRRSAAALLTPRTRRAVVLRWVGQE